jgi:hypothetical protein
MGCRAGRRPATLCDVHAPQVPEVPEVPEVSLVPGAPAAPRPGLDAAELLAAYDAELRTDAEVARATWVDRDGPLVRAGFPGGAGFVTYRDLQGFDRPEDGPRLADLIARTVAFFRDETDVGAVEWKARGHDAPADLSEHLRAQGFVAAERETVMLGAAALLAVDVPLPGDVRVRRIAPEPSTERGSAATSFETLRTDVARTLAMQVAVFGSGPSDPDQFLPDLLDPSSGLELWVVEHLPPGEARTILCAGRLEVVRGTSFAGLWGGATLPAWRGRGLYRALTAARARSALAHGARFLHSDSTDASRPILERAGLQAVTTTTPWEWRRPAA